MLNLNDAPRQGDQDEWAATEPDGVREIADMYPLPRMDTLTLTYARTQLEEIKVHTVKIVEGEVIMTPIASPFGVVARLRHVDQADDYGLRCLVQDMDSKPRVVDFDRSQLPKMAASEIRSLLYANGLRTEVDGEKIVVQVLKAAKPERELIVFRRTGWQEVVGVPEPIFLTPNGTVFGAPNGLDLELTAAARMAPDVAVAGTLDGWQTAVAAAVSFDTECPHWILGVVAAFAGPIVSLTGLDTCGINLSGMSTSGKSTAQRLSVSAWSTPDIRRPGLCQSARSTDNAIEVLAQRATGTVLSLDELAHLSGKEAAKVIYMIAAGIGKLRMTADATVRDSYTWATFAIFSGECSLEEKIRDDGGEWLAGMAARIVDIDVTGINRNVDAGTLRAINDIEHHYGHAGPAFVRGLIENGLHRQASELRERVLKTARLLAGGNTADSATVRAATPLALVLIAGELAKKFDLIPAETLVAEAVRWAWDRFTKSSDATALDPEAQTILNLRVWIAERWGVTIKSVDAENGINNRETIAWYDNTAIYIPKVRIREAAGKALKESQIGAVLDRRGLLAAKSEGDRFTVKWVPKIGKVIAYALSRREFGRSSQSAGPDPFTVHEGGASD